MKILFIGDYSNYHNTLARSFSALGHKTVVASDGDLWKDTARTINLSRKPGRLGSYAYFGEVWYNLLMRMRGFDIVYLVNPNFLALLPPRLKPIFQYLKRYNGKVILSAIGNDTAYYNACLDGKTFRYSDVHIDNEPSPLEKWLNKTDYDISFSQETTDWNKYVVDNVDGIVSCLYEYSKAYEKAAPEKICYGGIPIAIPERPHSTIEQVPDKVKFFIGIQRQRSVLKGTDRMLEALKRVQQRHPDEMEIKIAESVPYNDYLKLLHGSHVILDQLYSYTPATNALENMANGIVAVSGAEPEYYNFIHESKCRPIINVSPVVKDDIEHKLEWIIQNKTQLPELSRQSEIFVRKHNDALKVAQRHIDYWERM